MQNTTDIVCLKCRGKESYIKYAKDGSEYGECSTCGNITYRKLNSENKRKFEENLDAVAQKELRQAIQNRNRQQKNSENITHEKEMVRRKIIITCPYCHSTNTTKITMTQKAIKGWLWGIAAASTLSKEWHCNNCKSDF